MKNKQNKRPMKTPNDGASVERAAIKRHIKSLILNPRCKCMSCNRLRGIIAFIDSRKTRNAKRPGGLGRK